ncbi:polyprenyl synthetase family protein [Nocardia sp. NPDC050408]|uniref:polyprenyl synthetase family protein n=1 Tax=Nocardia sp. NPDC050408 TaxID=3364319 RepID=UPI003790DF57
MTTTTGTDFARVAALQERTHNLCTPVLREWVQRLPDPLRHMAGYHYGWWDSTGAPVRGSSGKSLRPMLVFATAVACGAAEGPAVPAAVALQLVHDFSLIHDDVLDGDHTRRGRATVWSIWGVADAILLGDALHALAIQVLSAGLPAQIAGEALARLEAAVIEMCRGQCEDCRFEVSPTVGIDDYVRMAAGKTAALMGCACALGALCAGADARTVDAMDAFGRELGLAFQFVDDVLGIWGDPTITGKPVGGDIARRKRSLPVVAALAADTDEAAELSRMYRSDGTLDPSAITRATMLIELTGGKETAEQRAAQQIAAALALLPEQPSTGDLTALAQMIGRRDR